MTDLVTDFDRPAVVVEPTINILALDLGTSCGWALSRGGVLTYGTKDFHPRRSDSAGQRWLKFRALLANQYVASGELHTVYYEDVQAHGPKDKPNTLAAHVYGGFLAHLEAWADVQRVRLVPVGVGQVKKHWTGRGNAKKEDMVAEARRRKFKVAADEDNTADALAILHLAIEMETK